MTQRIHIFFTYRREVLDFRRREGGFRASTVTALQVVETMNFSHQNAILAVKSPSVGVNKRLGL